MLPAIASGAVPVILVNTESFQTIDNGDTTTNIELRFGSTLKGKFFYDVSNSRFQVDRAFFVGGNLTATGALSVKRSISGASLRIDGGADIWGTLSASGALKVGGTSTLNGATTITGNTKVRGNLSGSSLNVDGNANVTGLISATGSIITKQNLTINGDSDTNDAVFTFGNNTANQTLKFMNTAQRFEFSKNLKVNGAISGSSLVIDGNVTLRGVQYAFPTSQGGANTFLKNDGAGNLTWGSSAVGNGSGEIISLHPEYTNAIYFASGATAVGQLSESGGTTALDNTYLWTSTRSGIQDYWISVRVRLPDNFSSWDPVKPIEFRYKTGVASAANNHLTVRMKDTAGTDRPLTGGSALANVAFTTASITGPEAGGTWTPKGYFTVYIKLAANSTAGANAAAGFINFNFETTTP